MTLRDTSDHAAESGSDSAANGALASKGYVTSPAVLAAVPMTVDMVPEAQLIDWPQYDEVVYSSPIEQIHTMAEMMQFKGGTDKDGVSQHMRNVSVAEVAFGKVGFVWRNLKKKKFVADGHQRLGMFKRAQISRQGNPLRFHYFRLEEEKGWTVDKARLFAAYVNIAEDGPTTKPMDVARLFRNQENTIDLGFLRKYLPARNRCLEQGLWLSKLGPEAFALMENHPGIQASWGVLVSQHALVTGSEEDKKRAADTQVVLLETLLDAKPRSDEEAADIIVLAKEAGFTEVEQLTLFGKTTIRETLIPQRFKIYREVRSLVRRRLQAVETVLDDKMTQMTLKVDAESPQIVTQRGRLKWSEVMLKRQANIKGPISTELSTLALRLKNNEITLGQAGENMFARLGSHVDDFRRQNPAALSEEEAQKAAIKDYGHAAARLGVTRDMLAGVTQTHAEADAAPTMF